MEMLSKDPKEYLNMEPQRQEFAEYVAFELEQWRFENQVDLFKSAFGG